MREQKLVDISESCFIDPDYKAAFSKLGLTSIDDVFSFQAGRNLAKNNLAKYRSRVQFEINAPAVTVYLKRYDRPPISVQLKNWITSRRRISCGLIGFKSASELTAVGIHTPKTLFYGEQWGTFFEKRSFIITEKIPNAESLERRLPGFFSGLTTVENIKLRRDFIAQLAVFVKKFHETGYCHRDLYLSHIFHSDSGDFYLIDLARAFKPGVRRRRFLIKDIAQVYYSAPAKYFSKTDRLRFYITYAGRQKLNKKDKAFIRKVINRAKRMARHDMRHSRPVPFESRPDSA